MIRILLWLPLVAGVNQVFQNMDTWQKETNISLDRNIRKNCKWKVVAGLDMPTDDYSDTFYVTTTYPTRHELNVFQKLPSTLTKSNDKMTQNALKKDYFKWMTEKGERWEVPHDHEGQKRGNCMDVTMKVSNGSVLSLYEDYKQVKRTFYLLRNRHGVIHPSGSVMFSCGYYMGFESCETKWDQAGDWSNKCYKALSDNNLEFKHLWPPSSIHAGQYHDGKETASTINTHQLRAIYKGNITLSDIYQKQTRAVDERLKVTEKHKLAQIKMHNCSIRWDILEQKELNGSYIYAPKYYKRVFVVTAVWDYNYHHFIADTLARLVRHVRFLRQNPDIYIHIRVVEEYEIRSEEFKRHATIMRNGLFKLLGIEPSRLIWGIVYAEQVYIPRCMHCAYTLSNPMEIRLLAKELLFGARKQLHHGRHYSGHVNNKNNNSSSNVTVHNKHRTHSISSARHLTEQHSLVRNSGITARKKNLIIQQRYTSWGSTDREWDNQTALIMVKAFTAQFPEHNIVHITSLSAQQPHYCLACEIQLYSQADIIVGAHGAGLTNIMFMSPGSLLIEVFGDFKDVNMPLCGYYGPLSAIFGHHHYLYSFDQHDEQARLNMHTAEVIAKEGYAYYTGIKHSSEN